MDDQVELIFRHENQFDTADTLRDTAACLNDGANTFEQMIVGSIYHRLVYNLLEH